MAERLTPGVYVEEVDSGIKPIQSVGTATVGFIGETARGVPDLPTFVRGFSEFESRFGGHQRGRAGHLAQAVEAFFAAGGSRAYVVRVLPGAARTAVGQPIVARDDDPWGDDRPVLRFDAIGRGAWADHVRIDIDDSRAFRNRAFTVRVDWVEGGRSRAVEEFADVVLDPESPDYVVEVVADRSRYVRAVDLFAAGLDADPPSVLPIPEVAPRLTTRDGAGFTVGLGGTWTLRWSSPEQAEPVVITVEFTNAALTAAGATIDGDEATLTPAQLQALLVDQLGPGAGRPVEESFRVIGPGDPASLVSTPAPWNAEVAQPASLEIDGNAVAIPLAAAGPASLPPAAGPLDLSPGDTVTVTVDGGQPQSYALVAGDVANPGQMTPAEAATVLNRELVGIQAFLDGNGDLVLRSDTAGLASTIAAADDLATALGNPPAAVGGAIADRTAVTADELADAINAVIGGVFAARVTGTTVRIEQVDLGSDHTLQWTGDAAFFADGTLQQGTGSTGAARLTIEAPAATRALVAYELDPANPDRLAQAFTLTVADADGTNGTDIALPADGAGNRVTVGLFADGLNAAIDGAGLDDRVLAESITAADGTQTLLVRSLGPRAAGESLALAVAGAGASPWAVEHPLQGGRAGVVVDDLALMDIAATEPLTAGGAPRSLLSVLAETTGRGYAESSPANPALLPAVTDLRPHRLTGGDDGPAGATVGVAEIRGSDGRPRTGLQAFDDVDIQILCAPGRNDEGVLAEVVSFVGTRNVFFVADGPGSDDRDYQIATNDVVSFVQGLPSRTDNMAMFYPWVEVSDPVGVGRAPRRFVPPSGHMAGVFARTDRLRGVWKAPAGLEATLPGALGLQQPLLDPDQDLLNPIGLSCIRDRPGAGIVSWGSRTLSSDPEWRYIPVRRTALFLKESLLRGLQWVVFEPNDVELWQRIAANITAFMLSLHRQGAFQGATPDEAFAVKCDRETNPQELVDLGIVTAQVAFAPLKPAEFVVVQISQKSLVAA